MADYTIAVQNTELWEGGYSNNAADSGGETYRGISRKNWRNWNGWLVIDAAKNQPDFPRSLDFNSTLQGQIVSFYRAAFWQYDGINAQVIANKIFDLSVNVGKPHAIKIAQMAVGVYPDEVYGPNTEQAINATDSGSLLTSIRSAAEQYHTLIVQTHPEDAQFLAGWLRRDAS